MPEAKTPQDRKTKAAPFKFTVDGKSYTLPAVDEEVAQKIPGGVTMDAVMRPDDAMAQMRLGFCTLEACSPSPAAMAALRSLPTERMLEVFGRWMGESSGSSE